MGAFGYAERRGGVPLRRDWHERRHGGGTTQAQCAGAQGCTGPWGRWSQEGSLEVDNEGPSLKGKTKGVCPSSCPPSLGNCAEVWVEIEEMREDAGGPLTASGPPGPGLEDTLQRVGPCFPNSDPSPCAQPL